jgi:hypothetical protein
LGAFDFAWGGERVGGAPAKPPRARSVARDHRWAGVDAQHAQVMIVGRVEKE